MRALPSCSLASLAFLAAFVLTAVPASAQPYPVRFGVGFEGVVALPGQDIVPEGFGVGARGRVSVPVNRDLSLAGEAGVAGFVLGGRDDAAYVFNPQLSIILTLPTRDRARYLLGGVGGFIPFGGGDGFDDPEGGPSLHLGFGWAFPLSETSLFVEVDPSLIVGASEATVVLPVRVGVIF